MLQPGMTNLTIFIVITCYNIFCVFIFFLFYLKLFAAAAGVVTK